MKKLVTPLVLCVAFLLPSAISRSTHAAKHPTNACGCYGDGNTCFCEKKAKCGCPGECEPKGCEEERQKKLQREIDEETRKAKDEEKAQLEKAQAKAKEEAAKSSKGDDEEEAGAAAPEKGKVKGKPGRKMTSAQKKQLQKLIDAYLAQHPDEAQRSLTEVRGDL